MGLLDSILSTLGLRQKAADADNGGEAAAADDERDLALEAEDDTGSFDFEHDIARYFTAEFRVETAWTYHERRAVLFEEYEIRDTQHWHQIKATFKRWLETPAAKAKYRTPKDVSMARMSTTQTMTLDDLKLELDPKGDLDPGDRATPKSPESPES